MSNERDRERLAAANTNEADAAPVVNALQAAGFPVGTIADLFNKKLNYRNAIPILVEWLPRVSNRDVKEDIVRALSVKWAVAAGPLLVAEFRRAADDLGLGWAIGSALETIANDEIADALLELAMNPAYGRAREMVVLGLAKLKDERVGSVLLNLLGDDEVVGHATIALGKQASKAARPQIEPLLKHPKAWVRKEARKALSRIDRAGG